ncbi:MAG: class I SAM-dependent DNA methyltransferase [Atopobiaceae bacterium]|nr:class I SAM-dependent DNA methyltransferase [Atopobiaceae bacterium]
MDWNDVLPASECSFIMGNPPFLGNSHLLEEQDADRAALFGRVRTVDYVACWYVKASDYTKDCNIRCAFVSTNSICQGQQVKPLWGRMFDEGNHIDFAYRTFIWNSEAADQAHVHCVIVGFSRIGTGKRRLFSEEGVPSLVDNINGYLENKWNVELTRHNAPLCDVLPMVAGGKPSDGGNLILSPKERVDLLSVCPDAKEWIRPYSMGSEFINGIDRYCLWLVGITKDELENMPPVSERVRRVRMMRLASKKEATQKKAATPWLFDEVKPPQSDNYIAVPKVSSGRRAYIPMGFVTNGMIPGDKLFFISDGGLYEFGILESQIHNAWVRSVAGRLKSDYSYSNTIVYNNFVWPENAADAQKAAVERAAQAVLDARANHPDDSLAKLYDPDLMPADLCKAHAELDSAVEIAYHVDFRGDEEKIVAHLFKLYAEKVKA